MRKLKLKLKCKGVVSKTRRTRDRNIAISRILAAASVGTVVISSAPVHAYESGSPGMLQMAGISIGNTTASVPGPGVYMFDQAFTYQGKLIGPGAPNVGGNATPASITSASVGFLWVPGWEILGAKYDAVIVQPATLADFGNPLNLMKAGAKNTYLVPAELSWKLGDSGFYVKAGLGIHAPDGTINGANGLGNIGNPWWTFQPQLTVSYLKDGWNLTALVSQEMNTKNTITDYRTGNILHAEATVTKTVGKWTLGPVAYYVGQVSDDKSSAFYRGAINTNRYNIWAAGGLVGYDFGGAVFKVWGFREFNADASGGTPVIPGIDHATQVQGWKVFANLSYRIWAPDAPAQQSKPLFYK